MQAMVLPEVTSLDNNKTPLQMVAMDIPVPGKNEIILEISACGVCRTELEEIEGRTPPSFLPIILGHQVVGRVWEKGVGVRQFEKGERVGIGWIYSACGACSFCREGKENLCRDFKGTGRDAHGGFAEYMVIKETFAVPIPPAFNDTAAAPLLCAGSIGYRSLKLTNLRRGQTLGLTGFGACGHLIMKMVNHILPQVEVFVFARREAEREFARQLGAVWTGDMKSRAPVKLDNIIDTTPAWQPVIVALQNLKPGGRLVINAIRKADSDRAALERIDYPTHLWLEKEIKSVANVTRNDIADFLMLAASIPLQPEVTTYPLAEANQALYELKQGKIRGAKVLVT